MFDLPAGEFNLSFKVSYVSQGGGHDAVDRVFEFLGQPVGVTGGLLELERYAERFWDFVAALFRDEPGEVFQWSASDLLWGTELGDEVADGRGEWAG